MADEVIVCEGALVHNRCKEYINSINGLKWVCYLDHNKIQLLFDWSDLKKQGVEGVKGYVMLQGRKIGVMAKEMNEVISVDYIPGHINNYIKLNLTLIKSQFLTKSENSDAILLAEDTKLHVNKAFLSYHSEFFGGLFAFESEEKQNDEYKIIDVSADDMKAVLAIIHPENDFPTDSNAEKLLELADRFMIPFATSSVENHLLKSTKIDHPTLVWLADKYRLKKLMKHAISLIDSIDTVRKLRSSPNFSQMSSESCRMLVDCLLQIKSARPGYEGEGSDSP